MYIYLHIWGFYDQCFHWDSCIQTTPMMTPTVMTMTTPTTHDGQSWFHRLIGMYAKWVKKPTVSKLFTITKAEVLQFNIWSNIKKYFGMKVGIKKPLKFWFFRAFHFHGLSSTFRSNCQNINYGLFTLKS